MTSGRFVPLATVTTAVVCSTFLMLGPAACHEEAIPECGDTCVTVAGNFPLTFQGDAGLPSDCANLNVQTVADGELLNIQQADGGVLTGTLTGVALTGQVFASGDLSLNGLPLPSSDGGLSTSVNVTAVFTGGPDDAGSLTGTFTGLYSRIQGTNALRCTVTRPFTATRQ